MCLGIPGKVVEISDEGPLKMARVDFGGVRKEACLAYVPEVQLGDYVIVHVGFAISQVDEEEALRTLEMLKMIDELGLEQELGTMPDASAGGPNAVASAPNAEGGGAAEATA
jgi:hydrogenase expression/formation protein HypC